MATSTATTKDLTEMLRYHFGRCPVCRGGLPNYCREHNRLTRRLHTAQRREKEGTDG